MTHHRLPPPPTEFASSMVCSWPCVRKSLTHGWAKDLDPAKLDAMAGDISLSEAISYATALLAGKVRGRLVVDVSR